MLCALVEGMVSFSSETPQWITTPPSQKESAMSTRDDPVLPAYPDDFPVPTSPEEARALLHTMIDALDDAAAEALCRFLAWWWSGPVGRWREGA